MKPFIFLDLDGVLANFVDAACEIHGINPDFSNYKFWRPTLTDKEFWARINSRGHTFWENIPKYSWADQLLGMCEERADRVVFCTSVDPRGSGAAKGKYEWVFNHFGYKWAARMIVTKKKFLLAGPNRILVDDTYSHLNKFHQWGGHSIMFPQPWNTVWSPEFENGKRIAYTRAKIKHYTEKVNDES